MFYFFDGASAKYKNKLNVLNLCMHNKDLNIKAEQYFSAIFRGKNACEGIGGTVKRLTTQARLRRVYTDQIMTASQLYYWLKLNIKLVNFIYLQTNNVKKKKTCFLETIFYEKPISSIQKLSQYVNTD